MKRDINPDIPILAKVLGLPDPLQLHNLRGKDGKPVFKDGYFGGRFLKWRDALKLAAIAICGPAIAPEERDEVWNLLTWDSSFGPGPRVTSDEHLIEMIADGSAWNLRYLSLSPGVPKLTVKPEALALNLDLLTMAKNLKKGFAAIEQGNPKYFEKHVLLGRYLSPGAESISE